MKPDVKVVKVPVEISAEISNILGENWLLLVEPERTLMLAHNPYNPAETLDIGRYMLFKGKQPVASFELHPMTGCCAIAVSTRAFVEKRWRGKGIGTTLNKLRIHLAREQGYGAVICTDVAQNEPQRRIMQKNGWKDVFNFRNPRTRNEIFIDVVAL